MDLKLNQPIYLDYMASSKPHEEVIATYAYIASNYYANNQSIHNMGIESSLLFEKECNNLLHSVDASKDYVVVLFDNASHANSYFIDLLRKYHTKNIFFSGIEHSSLIRAIHSKDTLYIDEIAKDRYGNIDYSRLRTWLKPIIENPKSRYAMAFSHVNNELGTILDLGLLSKLKKYSSNIITFIDCCQSYAKLDIDMAKYDIDAITISAHKINGLKGIAALICKREYANYNFVHGTQNLAGLCAFNRAFDITSNEFKQLDLNRLQLMRSEFIRTISSNKNFQISCNFDPKNSVPWCINFSVIGADAKKIIINVNELVFSTGSACNKFNASEILTACGLNKKELDGAMRVSFDPIKANERTLEIAAAILLKELNNHV